MHQNKDPNMGRSTRALYNEVEKKVSGLTDEGEKLNVNWQVPQVSRPFFSVTELSEAA